MSNGCDFEKEIKKHYKIFIHLANKYIVTLNNYDKEDLIHIQILACYNARDKYDKKHKISSFFYSVAENALKGVYRKDHRLKRKPRQLSYTDINVVERSIETLHEQNNAEHAYYVSEIKTNAFIIAKEILSSFEYKLFIKHIIENKSIEMIANENKKTEKQIYNGITRMKKKLREKRELIMRDM